MHHAARGLGLAFCALRRHLLSMTLLQKRDLARQQRRLDVFGETRRCLQSALRELISGQRVLVFGSLIRPGAFNDRSDVALAPTLPWLWKANLGR
jgi:hypothetical protein